MLFVVFSRRCFSGEDRKSIKVIIIVTAIAWCSLTGVASREHAEVMGKLRREQAQSWPIGVGFPICRQLTWFNSPCLSGGSCSSQKEGVQKNRWSGGNCGRHFLLSCIYIFSGRLFCGRSSPFYCSYIESRKLLLILGIFLLTGNGGAECRRSASK